MLNVFVNVPNQIGSYTKERYCDCDFLPELQVATHRNNFDEAGNASQPSPKIHIKSPQLNKLGR